MKQFKLQLVSAIQHVDPFRLLVFVHWLRVLTLSDVVGLLLLLLTDVSVLQVPLQLIECAECRDMFQLHITCKDCKVIR